jgi:hypothetical protein
MRTTFAAAALVLALAACGKDPAPGPVDGPPVKPPPAAPSAAFAAEGAVGARAVVDAYLAAARAGDGEAMYALGTPEWREKERTWKKGFTPAIGKKELVVKTADVREPAVEGEKATVSVGAVFVVDGKDDKEGMRFTLERRDGRWWITDLR